MVIRHCYSCKSCIRLYPILEEEENKCPYCGNRGEYIDSQQYDEQTDKTIGEPFEIPSRKQKDPYISSHEFDKIYNKPEIHCPYCNSTNCKKLGAISRGVSFGLFGFGSGSIGKQWKCRDCGSAF